MKTLVFFGFMMAMSLQILAQTPSFIFSLKATNALGYKDSVQIGTYDLVGSLTNPYAIVGLDGPQLAGTPADSNMDLRVAFMNNRQYQTDKRILPSLCNSPIIYSPMQHNNQVIIYIFAKKWPVQLSWDSTQFAQTYCVNKSFFAWSRFSTAFPPYIDLETYPAPIRMAAMHGSLKIDSVLFLDSPSGWLWGLNPITLNNGKQGKYFCISLYLNHTLNTSTKNSKKPLSLSLSLYPNPIDDLLNIEQRVLQGSGSVVKIWTMQGQLVQNYTIQNNTNNYSICTTGLKSGMYKIEWQAKDGSIARGKFVKR